MRPRQLPWLAEGSARASEERQEEEWERLFGPDDGDDENGLPIMGRSDRRAVGLKPQSR